MLCRRALVEAVRRAEAEDAQEAPDRDSGEYENQETLAAGTVGSCADEIKSYVDKIRCV